MTKPPKGPKKVNLKLVTNEAKVFSLINKLEKKTEKQMATFVKEIVTLKKNQNKLKEQLEKEKIAQLQAEKKAAKKSGEKRKKNKKKRLLKIVPKPPSASN